VNERMMMENNEKEKQGTDTSRAAQKVEILIL
jgi:hypothetical protein